MTIRQRAELFRLKPDAGYSVARIGLFIAVALLTLVMIWQAQFGENQLNLLARGYLLAKTGQLIPYGNPMTGGGHVPGTVTSLIIGLPLMVWFDYHAPEVALWALHLIGYLVIDAVLQNILTRRGRFFFFLFYWITPWHIYYSVQLCNPSYLYFFSAVLFWTVYQQRQRSDFWFSAIHMIALVGAAELHGSALIYIIHSALLWYWGYVRVSYRGILFGGLIMLLTLIPWLRTIIEDPHLLPASAPGHYIGYGLVHVAPVLRGLLYIVKLPTFFAFSKVYRFDFRALGLQSIDSAICFLLHSITWILGIGSLIFSALAMYWFYRPTSQGAVFGNPTNQRTDVQWLRGVVVLGHLASAAAFSLSPTGINYWDVIGVHYLAALPVALYADQCNWVLMFRIIIVRWFALAYIPLGLLVCIGVGFGSPMYRLGGRSSVTLPLRNSDSMFTDLSLLKDFNLKTYDDGRGWWPDVLPDKHPPLLGYQGWLGKPWEQPGWQE